MRRYSLVLFIIFLLLSRGLASTDDWHTAKSRHFIVYYRNAEGNFIDKLIDKAEMYYDKIADDLGFRRYNFWLWENRAKIYIYDTSQDYQIATQQPSWSSGCAKVVEKVIYTFPNAKGFFETILPHELGHIIFREFVGFDNPSIPLWLEEGVASYQERLRYSAVNKLVIKAIKENKFMNIEILSNFNLRGIQDTELVNLFYIETVSIIDYLVKEFGKDDFVSFCQKLRDKRNLEKALVATYGFRNIAQLDQAWQEYLKNE
jgi:hypothetical protein